MNGPYIICDQYHFIGIIMLIFPHNEFKF